MPLIIHYLSLLYLRIPIELRSIQLAKIMQLLCVAFSNSLVYNKYDNRATFWQIVQTLNIFPQLLLPTAKTISNYAINLLTQPNVRLSVCLSSPLSNCGCSLLCICVFILIFDAGRTPIPFDDLRGVYAIHCRRGMAIFGLKRKEMK